VFNAFSSIVLVSKDIPSNISHCYSITEFMFVPNKSVKFVEKPLQLHLDMVKHKTTVDDFLYCIIAKIKISYIAP
jgi:hypothetical protein